MKRTFLMMIVIFFFLFLLGCQRSAITGEFIRDDLEASALRAVTFDDGTHVDFEKETIGFSTFAMDCAKGASLQKELVSLWNELEEARIGRLQQREQGLQVEEPTCPASSPDYAHVVLLYGKAEKELADCSGTLQSLATEAATYLDACWKVVYGLAGPTDEVAFRFCKEDAQCKIVPSINGLNKLPDDGETGCQCFAAINYRFRDYWFKARTEHENELDSSCPPCEEPKEAVCEQNICVPVY